MYRRTGGTSPATASSSRPGCRSRARALPAWRLHDACKMPARAPLPASKSCPPSSVPVLLYLHFPVPLARPTPPAGMAAACTMTISLTRSSAIAGSDIITENETGKKGTQKNNIAMLSQPPRAQRPPRASPRIASQSDRLREMKGSRKYETGRYKGENEAEQRRKPKRKRHAEARRAALRATMPPRVDSPCPSLCLSLFPSPFSFSWPSRDITVGCTREPLESHSRAGQARPQHDPAWPWQQTSRPGRRLLASWREGRPCCRRLACSQGRR